MKFILIIVFINSVFSLVNLNKCQKKLFLSKYFIELRMRPCLYDLKEKGKLFDKKYKNIIGTKKDIFINDPETKNLVVHSAIDTTTDDISEEISELISLLTDINKEALSIFQNLAKEYFRYNFYDQLNKKYEISVETKDLILIIIRNVIVPTIVHDIFQTLLYQIKHMNF